MLRTPCSHGVPANLVALIPGEVGGGNGLEPLTIGSRMGLPVVDGDYMGRAFPELQVTMQLQKTCELSNCSCTSPVTLALHNNVQIVAKCTHTQLPGIHPCANSPYPISTFHFSYR
jgi:DUF917 family protein